MLQKLIRPSLFRELFGWQLLVMMVAITANFAYNIAQAYKPLTGGLDTEMVLEADAIARFSALNPTPVHAQAVAHQVRQLNEINSKLPIKEGDFGWQVWTADGQLLSTDGMAASFAKLPPGSLEPRRRHDLGDWRVIAATSPDGKIWTVVGHTQSFYRQIDDKILHQIILIPLIYTALLMAALWLATWRGLQPLQRLGQRIAERNAGSQEPIADATYDPMELQPITAALDAYAVREANLRAAEQRFFADAAHELRTPLAVIGAQAHVLDQERDPTRQAALLQTLQHGVQRAGAVLTQVLVLSRLDATGFNAANAAQNLTPVAATTIDLGHLLRDRVEAHAMRAIGTGHDLGLACSPTLQVHANVALLHTAIDNLIDNALRYCPSGSRIDLTWGEQDGVAWWAVEDDGPGIPAKDQERVFKRFERGAGALDVTGSGLGLAIAREVARQQGGSLKLAATASGRGCRFVMLLGVGVTNR